MIVPLGERILAIPIPLDNPPEVCRFAKAEVLAVGPSIKSVKVKDIIYYNKYAAMDLNIDGHKCVLMYEEDALAYEMRE